MKEDKFVQRSQALDRILAGLLWNDNIRAGVSPRMFSLEAIGMVLIGQKPLFVLLWLRTRFLSLLKNHTLLNWRCHATCFSGWFLTVVTISIMAFISSNNISKTTFGEATVGKAFGRHAL